jgi:transmembrane sensor
MTHDTEAASSAEQAAHWWVIFHGDGATAAEHREFAEWVSRSPQRVEAYLHMARLHQTLTASAVRWPTTPADVLVREAREALPDTLPLTTAQAAPRLTQQHRRRTASPVRMGMRLAAVMVLGIAIATLAWMRPQQYQTRFGEQRSVLLDDGSRVTLNTASKIRVRLRPTRRVIELIEGEALFEVAHDPARPFDVMTDHALLRAVGTQFDVDKRPQKTVVTVVEGTVRWASGLDRAEDQSVSIALSQGDALTAKDRLVLTASGAGEPQHGVDASAATSWTHNQLIFEHRSLGEVVDEFNRYNRTQIRIGPEQLRARQITGVFQSNDSASFLAFLSSLPGVRIRDDGAGNRLVELERLPQ